MMGFFFWRVCVGGFNRLWICRDEGRVIEWRKMKRHSLEVNACLSCGFFHQGV